MMIQLYGSSLTANASFLFSFSFFILILSSPVFQTVSDSVIKFLFLIQAEASHFIVYHLKLMSMEVQSFF